MDTLLTAFLSSGMDSLQQHKQCENYHKKVIGDYLVVSVNHDDTDRFSNHLNKLSAFPPPISMMSTAGGDTSTILALEIDVSPYHGVIEDVDMTYDSRLCSPYQSFLQHQMNHKLISKRVSTSYYLPNLCCLALGYVRNSKHLVTNFHKCCDEKTMFEKVDEICTCQNVLNLEEGIQCITHGVYVSDLIKAPKHCSWTQNYLGETPQKPSACFGNPMFELNINTIDLSGSTDSIEVSFSCDGEYESLVYDDTLTSSLQGISFSFNDGYLDSDEDSLVYETSDDEDDCYDLTTFSKTEKDIDVLDMENSYINPRKISKYHCDCVPTHKDDYYSNRTQRKQSKTGYSKQVRFAGETTVHPLVVWNYAYKESRKGTWVKVANDRAHFQRRVHNVSNVLNPVLEEKLESIKKKTK